MIEIKNYPEDEADVLVRDDFSMVLFFAHTETGESWLDEHLPDDCPRMGKGFAVESRYASDIIMGMVGDELNLHAGVL